MIACLWKNPFPATVSIVWTFVSIISLIATVIVVPSLPPFTFVFASDFRIIGGVNTTGK